jgi:hypothetical protein
MPTVSPAPLSGRFLSFVDRKRSLSCMPRAAGYAKPLGGWAGRRRRSRGSYRRNAATRGGGLEYRATTKLWHKG